MGKVVQFTGKWKGNFNAIQPPQTSEDVLKGATKVHIEHTEIIVSDAIQYLMSRIIGDGINLGINGDIANFDMNIVREAIRSVILRFYNIEYGFQGLARNRYEKHLQAIKNKKEIEEANPMMKTELEPEPNNDGPMVG